LFILQQAKTPNVTVFSENIERALAQAMPGQDPLDAADFDPINYINRVFPTGTATQKRNTCIYT
jgi:hypothetical protein